MLMIGVTAYELPTRTVDGEKNVNFLLKTGRSSENNWIAYCPDLGHVISPYPANF